MRYFSFYKVCLLCLLPFLLFLPGCARYVQSADYSPALEVPQDARPAPIKFVRAEILLPIGTDIGFESDSSRLCGWPRYPVSRTVLRDAIDEKFLRQTFHDALEGQGYDVTESLDIVYDLEDEENRAEYSITAKIKDAELEMCHNEPDNVMVFFTTRRGVEGELYMDVDWTIYDALHRKVAYTTRTKGYTKRRIPNQEGLELMFSDAFEMAAHNLGADKAFYNLIVNGTAPADWRKEKLAAPEKETKLPVSYDPGNEEITLPPILLSKEPFTKDIDRKRKAAVMIEKFGHGSGFFITKQGHILTAAHVVGDAERIRVVTSGKKQKLVARVLRVDKTRDVALLKLEEIPDGLDIVTLPLRAQWPSVGEDAYMIGAPYDSKTAQDTVTKGIISAHRPDTRFKGVKQNFIQADISVRKGSDGSPLIDVNGNIAGIAAGSLGMAENPVTELSFFIPIEEALKALDIQALEE